MPDAGWYNDPVDASLLRYWDGKAWGETKPKTEFVETGSKVQAVGDGIAKTGCAFTWIFIGIAILIVVLLLL